MYAHDAPVIQFVLRAWLPVSLWSPLVSLERAPLLPLSLSNVCTVGVEHDRTGAAIRARPWHCFRQCERPPEILAQCEAKAGILIFAIP